MFFDQEQTAVVRNDDWQFDLSTLIAWTLVIALFMLLNVRETRRLEASLSVIHTPWPTVDAYLVVEYGWPFSYLRKRHCEVVKPRILPSDPKSDDPDVMEHFYVTRARNESPVIRVFLETRQGFDGSWQIFGTIKNVVVLAFAFWAVRRLIAHYRKKKAGILTP